MKETEIYRPKFGKNFPKITKLRFDSTVLDNGLTVLSEEVPAVESFALGICAKIGSRDDTISGITHFLEHAAYKRTNRRTSHQIASRFELIGAYTNAFTTKEYTFFYVRALTKHFKKVLDLLIDITFNSVYHERDIKRELSVITEEIKSYDDDTEEYIFDLGDSILFKGSPLENPIVGKEDSVKKINASTLKEYQDEYYTPNNLVFSFAGNIHHEKVVSWVAYYTQQISRKQKVIRRTQVPDYRPENITIKQSVQQSHLLLGRRVYGLDSEERYGMAILNVLFGDGMSSRIYQRLREKNGIAYSVYSTLQTYHDSGALYIYSAQDEHQTRKAIKLLKEEILKMKSGKITNTEFIRAKEQLKSGTIMDLESLSSRMISMARNEMYLGKSEQIDDILQKIDAINIEEIQLLAKKYFDYDEWSLIQILPE